MIEIQSDDNSVYIHARLMWSQERGRYLDHDMLKEIIKIHGRKKTYVIFNLWEEVIDDLDINFLSGEEDISFRIEDNCFRNVTHVLPRNVHHVKHPYYFLYQTIAHGKNHVNNKTPSVPFCFLNGKARKYRQKLWDMVEKDELVTPYCSFLRHGVFSDIEFNLAESINKPEKVVQIAFCPADFYNRVMIDMYVEPEVDRIRFTEKTWKPLFHEKVAFGFSAKDYYRTLKWQGFKVFDNVIDYSFDSIENNDERLSAFYEQFKRLLSMDTKDLARKTQANREHNRKRCATLIRGADIPVLPTIEPEVFFHLQKRDVGAIIK